MDERQKPVAGVEVARTVIQEESKEGKGLEAQENGLFLVGITCRATSTPATGFCLSSILEIAK